MEPTSIRLQASWINDSEFVGYFAAMAEGLYAARNITLAHLPGHSGLVPELSLLNGSADIALSSPESVVATMEETGADLRIIGAQLKKSPLSLVSAAANPLDTLAKLSGRRVGVPPANRLLFQHLLKRAGVAAVGIEIVDYAHDADQLPNGVVDAFIDFPIAATYRYAVAGYQAHVTNLWDLGATLPNNVVVVTASALAEAKSTLRHWMLATRAGWQINAEDPEALLRRLWRDYMAPGLSLDQELHANRYFCSLMGSSSAYMGLSTEGICRASLALCAIYPTMAPAIGRLFYSVLDE